jgi:hypothetical protein
MKVLAPELIKKLLKEEKVSTTSDAYKERWPGEKNIKTLAEAVNAGAKSVLFDTKKFLITYYPDVVRINPTEGFAPMGYFSRKELDGKKK